MRKTLIILTTLLSLFLVSCSTNSTSSKAVEEGKIALVSKEYDKAKDLFKLAINEDSKNTDASSLLDLTTNYIELLSIIDSSEFDKSNDLISKIESNDKLDIIKDSFNDTKNNLNSKKEIFDKYITEIESIETLLTENKIDDAKSQAIAKLEEVKEIKSLGDRLNSVITNADEIIATAKETILKYYNGEYDIKYRNMEFFDNSEVTELNGKAILNFIEDQDFGSPHEYIYRIEDGDVFRLNQGSIYWVNNGNQEIYTINPPVEISTSNSNDLPSDYFTVEDAIREASKKFEEDFPLEKDNYQAKSNGVLSAGCYEVEFFDKGGRLFFGAYAFDAKSGVAFRI